MISPEYEENEYEQKNYSFIPLILAIIISGCGGGGGVRRYNTSKIQVRDNEITDFRFAAVKNGDGFSADSTVKFATALLLQSLWYRCHITGGGIRYQQYCC